MPSVTGVVLDSVPPERAGTASAVFNTFRQMGGAVAIAVFGALHRQPADLRRRDADQPRSSPPSLLVAAAIAAHASARSSRTADRTAPTRTITRSAAGQRDGAASPGVSWGPLPTRWPRLLRWRHGQPGGGARLPHHASREGRARGGGAPDRGRPSGAGLRRGEVGVVGRGQRRSTTRGSSMGTSRSTSGSVLASSRRRCTSTTRNGAPLRPRSGGEGVARPQPRRRTRSSISPCSSRPSTPSRPARRSSATADGSARDQSPRSRFYAPVYAVSGAPANLARFQLLDVAHARGLLSGVLRWVADDTVATLRADAARDPHDRELQELIGELPTRSSDSAAAGPPTSP